jgi:hypothetical protein
MINLSGSQSTIASTNNPPVVPVTLHDFMKSLQQRLENNAGTTTLFGSSQKVLNFLISWGHFEGGGNTNIAHLNPLNTKEIETGSVLAATGQPGTGVQSYPDAQTGEMATEKALNNGDYPDLLHALSTGNENALGFNNNCMANNIAVQLGIWRSGSNQLDSSTQNYILDILTGAGANFSCIVGGTIGGVQQGNTQGVIDQWGNATIGQSQTGLVSANPAPGWSMNDILKVAGGSLLILIAVTLFVKVQIPGSPIAKFIPFGAKK